MMTSEELQAIRERAERATPGPWEAFREFNILQVGTDVLIASMFYNPSSGRDQDIANAAFIAHARTDIPALLAEVERLQSVIEKLKEESDDSGHSDMIPNLYNLLH